MAHDQRPYASVGDEVASVLSSARDAGSEIRGQAQRYADTLLSATRNEIDDMRRNARAEAAEIVAAAKGQSSELLLETRREVIRIIESAQTRVTEAQAAAGKAIMRRQEMEKSQVALESKILDVIDSVRADVQRLREERNTSANELHGAEPSDEISSLYTRHVAALERDEM